MAELNEMTQRIVNKERAILEKKYQEEQTAAQNEVKLEKQRIKEKTTNEKKNLEIKCNQSLEAGYNTLQNDKRDQVLADKQKYIQKVFAKAKDKLDHLDEKTFHQFLGDVLNNHQLTDQTVVRVGEKSKDLINQDLLDSLVQESGLVKLSEETIAKQSGFILDQKGVQYNYIFSELVEEKKNDIISDLSKDLFN